MRKEKRLPRMYGIPIHDEAAQTPGLMGPHIKGQFEVPQTIILVTPNSTSKNPLLAAEILNNGTGIAQTKGIRAMPIMPRCLNS
ncbi:hypothetical protein [Neobacillus bataviensis]|uniref:hypothetical protein n=1 Tax=Neobacillus bataviensis TaxID=220685 RepID=UPI001CBC6817|nr:hypothetical protein [Neobacillus bataviensis]